MQKQEDRYSAVRNIPPRTASGPIVIKATCEEEIRRIPIVNQELTFEELCFMMHRLFRDRLSNNVQNMTLKYTDEDGDLITVTDSVDVSHALEHSNVLRVTVFDKETLPVKAGFPPHDLKKELKALKLTPQKAKGLKNSLLDLQKQIDGLIKTYCQEDADPESPSPAMVQKPAAKESKPALSTADMADLLDNNKASSIGSGVDFSKPRVLQQHGGQPQYDSFDPNVRSEPPRQSQSQSQPQPQSQSQPQQFPPSQQPYHSPPPQQSQPQPQPQQPPPQQNYYHNSPPAQQLPPHGHHPPPPQNAPGQAYYPQGPPPQQQQPPPQQYQAPPRGQQFAPQGPPQGPPQGYQPSHYSGGY